MPVPQDKYRNRNKLRNWKGQVYQLWLSGEMLAEDESLTELLKFAKEQITEEVWAVGEEEYNHVEVIRTETMEFDFSSWTKGTGLKPEPKKPVATKTFGEKVHKRNKRKGWGFDAITCSRIPQPTYRKSLDWEKVTCAKCLEWRKKCQ